MSAADMARDIAALERLEGVMRERVTILTRLVHIVKNEPSPHVARVLCGLASWLEARNNESALVARGLLDATKEPPTP